MHNKTLPKSCLPNQLNSLANSKQKNGKKNLFDTFFFLCFSLVADGIKVQSRINQNLQLGSYEENRDILNKADLV